MTDWEHKELLRVLLSKCRGEQPWFDYSPADVNFWENVRAIIEEWALLKKEAIATENYIIAKGI